ncbi:UNVERIFIED_CONTAM: hypothetical protein K2H54_038504, partial [Gekko kuhli]
MAQQHSPLLPEAPRCLLDRKRKRILILFPERGVNGADFGRTIWERPLLLPSAPEKEAETDREWFADSMAETGFELETPSVTAATFSLLLHSTK